MSKGIPHAMPESGTHLNEWTVLGIGTPKGGSRTARCRCSCGSEHEVQLSSLLSGKSRRCRDCGNRTAKPRGVVKHGALRNYETTPEYRSWKSMVERCERPEHTSYSRYGAVGVRVAERWRGEDGFTNFLADLGPRPRGTTLDRFPDFKGNYEPGNVRWATIAEQNRNKGDTRLITINGQTQCLKDWALERGLRYDTVHARIKRGWSVERALEFPGAA